MGGKQKSVYFGNGSRLTERAGELDKHVYKLDLDRV